MKTINVIIPIAKMKKSCGQNILPNKMNFPFTKLIIKKGIPFNFINGKAKNTITYNAAKALRILYNLPFGFSA